MSSSITFPSSLEHSFVLSWNWYYAVGLVIISLPYCLSSIRFWFSMRHGNKNDLQTAPVVPYFVPGLFHALYLLDPANFLIRLKRNFGSHKLLLVKAGFFRFFVTTSPDHIKAVFRSSKRMTAKSSTIFTLRHLLLLPTDASKLYWADNSGLGIVPRKDSHVPPDKRINFLIHHNFKKFLSFHHLDVLNKKYLEVLARELDHLTIEKEWTDFLDFYAFLQRIAVKSITETLIGSKVFELCPNFSDDLIKFHSYVPDLLRRLPGWFIPSAHRVRKQLLTDIKSWHEYAHQHSDHNKLAPEDPEWEPYFGSKLVKMRQHYALKIKEMTSDARATEDLGLLFASTGNVVTASFWFIYQALRDPKLLSMLIGELSSCCTDNATDFDAGLLMDQPLMQSTYAEVLRLYVWGVVSRFVEYDDIKVAGYSIPKDSYILMYSRSMAIDHEAWSKAGRNLERPLQAFDPERFMVDNNWTRPIGMGWQPSAEEPGKMSATHNSSYSVPSEKRFTLDGLLGLWLPFGGGDHLCPGRHLAKHIILLTFAKLITQFDIEIISPGTDVPPNQKFAPFGALPPACDVPFRIRRKAS